MFGNIARWKVFSAFFAILTVGIMALFFSIYEPWQRIGPELIPDGSFSTPEATNAFTGWSEWTVLSPNGGYGGSPGVVLTCSSNQNGVLRFTVHNLTNIPAFRASLRATAHGIVRGKEGYFIPRAIFFYNDAAAKSLFGQHHGVMDIPGDTGWRTYKDFFPVPAGAVNARFHIQNLGVAGAMTVDDLSVIPVRKRPEALWWRFFFGTLWAAAFGLCLAALRPWARRYGFLIMITLAVIMVGVVLPGKPFDDAIVKTARTVKSVQLEAVPDRGKPAEKSVAAAAAVKPKENIIAGKPVIVKQTHVAGHLILFSLLAFLSALSWMITPSLRRAAAVYAGLAFFAAATEILQFIPPDRSAELSDLNTDLAGMAVAVAFALILRLITRKWR